ncbi:hypothetical protein GCM10025873_18710 [Demequina sediminis]|uniref:DUF7059 domain-containing protein n=1 Tax=Demequina sediminis TaxID=1930058 RepID=UPI0033062789|nr:hypothetical protein GCM10025873_18710 [Demequina sediminis]
MTPRLVPTLTPASAGALRAALEGWTVDSVEAVIGERAARAFAREQVLPARLAARASSLPAAVLTRLFLLGDAVTRAELDRTLPGVGTAGAVEAGLIETAGEGRDDAVRALVDLRPYAAVGAGGEARWWVASDRGEAVTGARLREDHVLGIGGASLTLAGMTMRTPVGRVLDLGTGCGVQALHASLHAREVVATDVSRRALAFAAFNQALNAEALGAAALDTPWDLREGSMLDPVEGEQFDLVVSNPPFVITPPGRPPSSIALAARRATGSWRGSCRAWGACWRREASLSCWATGRCAARTGRRGWRRGSMPPPRPVDRSTRGSSSATGWTLRSMPRRGCGTPA